MHVPVVHGVSELLSDTEPVPVPAIVTFSVCVARLSDDAPAGSNATTATHKIPTRR
jgi:hypothetical protein